MENDAKQMFDDTHRPLVLRLSQSQQQEREGGFKFNMLQQDEVFPAPQFSDHFGGSSTWISMKLFAHTATLIHLLEWGWSRVT